MAVVVCNNTTPLSARSFAYSETLFNGGTFCSEGSSGSDCDAWRFFFNLGRGGRYIQGGQPDASLTPNKNTCQQLVTTLLNNNNFASTLLAETGCTTYRDANGSLTTGCQFSAAPAAFKTFTARSGVQATLVENVIASWTCSVTSSDPVYKTACCNAASSNLIVGTDPRTGQAFDSRACDPSWCLSDPDSVCSATFDVCDAISPCNRHYFLANIPLPSSDLMLNSLTLLPTNSFTPIKGIRCNQWYAETVKQAVQRTALPAVTDRVVSMMNTISGFCGDPRYRGQGECACYNGYLSFGVPWEREDSGDFLENQYDNVIGGRPPFIVQQDASGQVRRFDAFCSDIGNSSFSLPLSYSNNGTFITYSNVCSTTTPFSAIEYPYPTVNPARSIRSLTNYGDVVNYAPTDEFGAEIGIETFPMPMHCWLPACVAEGVPDTAVFRNLWALGVQPCPPICYQVSGGVNVSIGGSGAENAHIHDTYVSCDFGYKNSVFPFAYPPACRAMTMDVPANYQGSFTIPFTYASLDISSSFRVTSLSAFVNAFPVIALIDNGLITYSITDKLIDKYDPSNTDVQAVFNMSVSIDATYMDAFSSVLTEIVVANNTYQYDSIILKISVWGSTSNSRGPAFTSGCCAPEFGNGCTPTLEEQVGIPVMTLSDGRALSVFEQALEFP